MTVSNCRDSKAKEDTARAAVDLPFDAYVHTDRQMHIKLVSALTRGGGGSMPALIPCTGQGNTTINGTFVRHRFK